MPAVSFLAGFRELDVREAPPGAARQIAESLADGFCSNPRGVRMATLRLRERGASETPTGNAVEPSFLLQSQQRLAAGGVFLL